MSIRKLNSKYNYYKVESEIGNYHNPYDYHDEMMDLLNSCDEIEHHSEEWLEWEDKICDIGNVFFET